MCACENENEFEIITTSYLPPKPSTTNTVYKSSEPNVHYEKGRRGKEKASVITLKRPPNDLNDDDDEAVGGRGGVGVEGDSKRERDGRPSTIVK